MTLNDLRAVCLLTSVVWLPATATAQSAMPPAPVATTPAAPTPPWTGSAGFGLALNRGNTETTNINASFEATYDPKAANVVKLKGLYLRGDNNGSLAVDNLLLDGRDEVKLTGRVYAYGELRFIRDQFKAIDYLYAPNAGVGYKFIDRPKTTLSADVGAGAQIEKDSGLARRTDALVTASDKLEIKLSKTASITQGFTALWKTRDVGDAIYTTSAGVAAALTTRTQLKLEWLDTYVAVPAVATIKSNDSALLTTFVYKF